MTDSFAFPNVGLLRNVFIAFSFKKRTINQHDSALGAEVGTMQSIRARLVKPVFRYRGIRLLLHKRQNRQGWYPGQNLQGNGEVPEGHRF